MFRNLIIFSVFSSIGFFGFVEIFSEEIFPVPLVSDVVNRNVKEGSPFPRNYRKMKDEIDVECLKKFQLNLKGLSNLPIVGTSQFTETQLQEILKDLRSKVLVIDLREETHLILEDPSGKQVPFTAYAFENLGNRGKSVKEIQDDLALYKNYVLKQKVIHLCCSHPNHSQAWTVGNVYNEEELINKINRNYPQGVSYLHLPVTDHRKPTPKIVDEFLKVFENMKANPDLTILLHCRAGRGRTGTFMAMGDMLANAKKYELTFEQILKRQELLGSPNLFEPGCSCTTETRKKNFFDRRQFLSHFYQFVLAKDGLEAKTSYSSWLEKHPMDQGNCMKKFF